MSRVNLCCGRSRGHNNVALGLRRADTTPEDHGNLFLGVRVSERSCLPTPSEVAHQDVAVAGCAEAVEAVEAEGEEAFSSLQRGEQDDQEPGALGGSWGGFCTTRKTQQKSPHARPRARQEAGGLRFKHVEPWRQQNKAAIGELDTNASIYIHICILFLYLDRNRPFLKRTCGPPTTSQNLQGSRQLLPVGGLGSCVEGFSPQADVKDWTNFRDLGSLSVVCPQAPRQKRLLEVTDSVVPCHVWKGKCSRLKPGQLVFVGRSGRESPTTQQDGILISKYCTAMILRSFFCEEVLFSNIEVDVCRW